MIKSIIKIVHKSIIIYCVITPPLTVLFLLIMGLFGGGSVNLSGWFILWVLSAFYVVSAIIFSQNFRENLFVKLAQIKERDEREEIIVGQAARSTFLLLMGVTLILSCLSIVKLERPLNETSNEKNIQSKYARGFGITFDVNLFENPIRKERSKKNGTNVPVDQRSLINLSQFSLLILIFLIQLISFHYFSRKLILQQHKENP